MLTASSRLARVLAEDYGARQRNRGRSVWRTPDILPLSAWPVRAWHDWLLTRSGEKTERALLSPAQELGLWERVIRSSPQGETLLRIPETAARARDAWGLVQAYRLPTNGSFEASEDCAAFLAWARDFESRCGASGWVDSARLSDVVRDLARCGDIARPSPLYVAGFDEFTPQQHDLLDEIGEWRPLTPADFQATPGVCVPRDATEEIAAVAAWARGLLERNGEARIGVIVPNLGAIRARVERIFREVLHPGAAFGDDERSFHISLGAPLPEYPIVRAALRMLDFGRGPATLPETSLLLRSPFLGGADSERSARALLDAKLRTRGVWRLPIPRLREMAIDCPRLQRFLAGVERECSDARVERTASEWCARFSRLLSAFGWPGERPLSSREYQVVEAWNKALSGFASLDGIAGPMSFDAALDSLHELIAASPFQVENQGAPIQIMGLLEASGLEFDHLWVMGLHDEALPPSASPNPFLPVWIQRERKLPHSSAERELEYAAATLRRLVASAPDVVLSYPATEGDRKLEPSPLLAPFEVRKEMPIATNEWVRNMRNGAEFERLHDESAPPLPGNTAQGGGATLFRDMAACPFRAFAKHRLGAKPLEDTEPGPTKRDQGNFVHRALERIWSELQSQQRLAELPRAEIENLVERSVAAALQNQSDSLGRGIERIRLQRLLVEWLELERKRPPFEVLKSEEKRLVPMAGLQITTRADRIDRLPDGRHVILDYKTGVLTSGGWSGERPDDPQIPLYCATSEERIAAAAFARIRTGEIQFSGAAENTSLPDLKAIRLDAGSLGEQIVEWKRVLESLAENFSAGLATVDPKPNACAYCHVTALCRVRELRND